MFGVEFLLMMFTAGIFAGAIVMCLLQIADDINEEGL